MNKNRYLTAQEAAATLEITLPTLYAYVSRGLIRSEETEGKTRRKRYRLEDIEALKARKELRRNPAKAAETALHFGAPVLESAIALIAGGRLYYRGHDVLALARDHFFEEVAALIWTEELETADLFTGALETAVLTPYKTLAAQLDTLAPVEAFQVVLPLAATADLAAYDLSPTAVMRTGARILHLLTAVATGKRPAAGIAASLQQAWVPQAPPAAAALNAALILCADHELNVSSFTARCVASAGSNPYAVVSAGLAALQGHKHGGHTARVAALLREIDTPSQARPVIAGRLKRGEGIPGFGHRLYPDGDPRGQALLALVSEMCPGEAAVTLAQTVAAEVRQTIGLQPTIDFGLVTLARALQLPSGAAIALFALGRTAGWIGHALEQYQIDRIIRPRARYSGRQPASQ